MVGSLISWAPMLIVYGGLLTVVLGAICVVKPIRALRMTTRAQAARVLAIGAALVVLGCVLPVGTVRVRQPRTEIDRFTPVYQFNEVHTTRVHAPPEAVYRAIRAVTADEIVLFRTLTWIRSPRLSTRAESILNPQRTTPILDVALRTSFMLLAEQPNREIVVGTIVCCRHPPPLATVEDFRTLDQPDFAKATMNFLVDDEGGGWTRVRTETRVFATSDGARRRFAAYWRLIYPGSALIRRLWLAAIKRRAEAVPRSG